MTKKPALRGDTRGPRRLKTESRARSLGELGGRYGLPSRSAKGGRASSKTNRGRLAKRLPCGTTTILRIFLAGEGEANSSSPSEMFNRSAASWPSSSSHGPNRSIYMSGRGNSLFRLSNTPTASLRDRHGRPPFV